MKHDEDREVVLTDDLEILPDQTRDDTDAGWGEHRTSRAADEARYHEDRPPHWE